MRHLPNGVVLRCEGGTPIPPISRPPTSALPAEWRRAEGTLRASVCGKRAGCCRDVGVLAVVSGRGGPRPLSRSRHPPYSEPMPATNFPNLTVLTHPLMQHKLTILRDRDTATRDFKQLVSEMATLMAYEATKDLPTEPVEIETPLERTAGAGVRQEAHPGAHPPRRPRQVEGIAQLDPRPGRPHRALSRSRYAQAGGLLLQDSRGGGGARFLRARPDARHRRLGQ